MKKIFFSIVLASSVANAASKEECIDAHSRGQDYREKGQLRMAKKSFLTCAQSSCPNLVQNDCARFGEEIDRMLPTVSFGARDGKGVDVPNTIVFVDGSQIGSNDGKTYELDPGPHNIRFVKDGKETTLDVVLAQGEKGRFLAATFKDDASPASSKPLATTPVVVQDEPGKSAFPLVISGIGLAAVAVGSVLIGVGINGVPANCNFGTRECAAPINDPSFGKAQSSVNLANAGVGTVVAGGITAIGGLIWYIAQPKPHKNELAWNLVRGRF